MFSIRYTFQKGGPEYKCEYPEEKIKKYNIFIAKGPNDKGKSTMMQIIAYGLYGLEYEDISESLKEKIKRLTSETTDKFDFEYNIISHDNMVNLRSVQKNKDSELQVFVEDKIKSSTYLKDHFKIVYDIPEDPKKKLESSLTSIKDSFQEYKNLIADFKTEILRMMDQIEKIETKEDTRIKQIQFIINKEKDLVQLTSRKDKLSLELPELEKAYNVNMYNKLVIKHKSALKELEGLKKSLKEHETKGAGGGNKKYRESLSDFSESVSNVKFMLESTRLTRRLNNEDKEIFKSIKEGFDIIFIPLNYNNELTKKAFFFFQEKLDYFRSLPLYQNKPEEEEQVDLFKKIIEILNNFIDKNIEIPGTNGKNIAQFLSELEEQNRQLEEKLTGKRNLEEDIRDCKKLKEFIDKLISAKKNLPEKNDLQEGYDQLKRDLTTKKKEVDKLFSDIVQYSSKIENILPKERRSLEAYDESIFSIYPIKDSELNAINQRVDSINQSISEAESTIKNLDQTELETPSYSKDELKRLNSVAENIEMKIINGLNCIQKLIKKENNLEGCNEFYDSLFVYFANIIKLVYFEHKSWEVKKVDIIKERYEVKERTPIEFNSIGTGHLELNSLLARLKQTSLGKKKIILLDEMSTMDEKNLSILIEEIKNQVRSGEAIFAFLNRPDDKVDKVIFEPIEC